MSLQDIQFRCLPESAAVSADEATATAYKSGLCRFLSLADEIILAVIEQIDQSKDLCTLARTCARLQALTEPYIYRSILLCTGSDAIRLASPLDCKPKRALACKRFEVRYIHDNENGIEHVDRMLKHLRNLRHLTIESPCLNNSPWRGDEIIPWTSGCRVQYTPLFRAANRVTSPEVPPNEPLLFSKLQTVVLHTHGDAQNKFELGDDAIIFLHPTLRNLTISCSDITHSISLPRGPEKSTALQSLTFIECNINAFALRTLLRYPRALKEIDIGERIHRFHLSPTLPLINYCQEFMEALRQQCHSLEYIRHVGRRRWRPNSLQLGPATLRDFKSLQCLALDPKSILTSYLITNGAPESLKTLRLFSIYVHYYNRTRLPHFGRTEWKELMAITLDKVPHVPQVDIVLAHTFADEILSPSGYTMQDLHNIWQGRERRQDVYRFAFGLKDQGRHFKLYAEHFQGGKAFIPPFLYGEDIPVEHLVYDSEESYVFHFLKREKFQKDAEKNDRGYGKDEVEDEVIVLGLTG